MSSGGTAGEWVSLKILDREAALARRAAVIG
jgi:hypothetical protein